VKPCPTASRSVKRSLLVDTTPGATANDANAIRVDWTP
jgi:hypothetical protein